MEFKVFRYQLAELIETDVAKVTPEAELESLGWDSMAVVSFLAFADEKFGVILEPGKLTACETVGDLVRLLEMGISSANHVESPRVDGGSAHGD